VVVEELLELFVGQVDQELLKAVGLEDFKTSNIETADEGRGTTMDFEGAVDLFFFFNYKKISFFQSIVYLLDNPLEHALIGGLGESLARVGGLVGVDHLGNDIATGTDTGLDEGALEVGRLDAKDVRKLVAD